MSVNYIEVGNLGSAIESVNRDLKVDVCLMPISKYTHRHSICNHQILKVCENVEP